MKQLFLQLSLLFLVCTASAQTICYVDSAVSTSGSGTSWASPFKTLQEAFDQANSDSSISQIWIAKGTYRPENFPYGSSGGVNNRNYAFRLRNNLAIRGGFAGTETDTAQRVAGNTTIVDAVHSLPYTQSDHLFVTVNTDSTVCLDNLTLTGIGAIVSSLNVITIDGHQIPGDRGGGLYCYNAAPVIINCNFLKNASRYGGAIYNNASSPRVMNCTFDSMGANNGQAIYNNGASYPVISNSTFSNARGSTSQNGGVIYSNATAAPELDNCHFFDNQTYAISSYSNSSTTIGHCVFDNNYNGIFAGNSAQLHIRNSVFKNTKNAMSPGLRRGAIWLQSNSSATISNSLFLANESNYSGGAILSNSSGLLDVANCNFLGNNANNAGGAISSSGASVQVRNSIIWGNTAGQADPGINGPTTVSHSIVQGDSLYPGTGNINVPPLFVNEADPEGPDGLFGTDDDGLAPAYCSPAINAGSNAAVPAGVSADIRGLSRSMFGTVDLGPYEKQTSAPADITEQAALSNSSSNTISFLAACDDGIWTNYAIPGNADSAAFAIAWGGNTAARNAASVSITVDTAVTAAIGTDTATLAMSRYWNVDLGGQALSTPVSLRFYYATTDTTALHLAASAPGLAPSGNIQWFKTVGNNYDPSLVAPGNINNGNFISMQPVASGVANNTAWVEFDNITSFSGGTAMISATTGAPLPVTLTAFTAWRSADGNSALLTWKVTGEKNMRHYEVQRSADGTVFRSIGTVEASGKESYDHTDKSLPPGVSYYRLAMLGYDGELSYSRTCRLMNTFTGSVTAVPNPANDKVTIINTNEQLDGSEAIIFDLSGKTVHRFVLAPIQTIFLQDLAAGIYLLRLSNGESIKLIKE